MSLYFDSLSTPAAVSPIIFFNIGWMTHYRGPSESDPIQGGGSYVTDNQSGGEEFNFKAIRRHVFGYVQPSGGGTIHIERLGALSSDEELTGVTVVWTARNPTNGGTYVVGWYQNATVYRHHQELTTGRRSSWNWGGRLASYHVTAAAGKAVLLPPDARTLGVPRGKGAKGRSHVWYAEGELVRAFVKKVRALIARRAVPPPEPPDRSGWARRQKDMLKRLAVEQKAVELTWAYYEQLGYDLHSVEKDKVGWDLEAGIGKSQLKLEVKGLSGRDLAVELTPNEYRCLNSISHRASYRICVVTEALTRPVLHLFSYITELGRWVSLEGRILEFTEFVGARAYCS